MSFGKPKPPKPQEPAPIVEVNDEAVDETARAREARRQGWAASQLTGPGGLENASVGRATRSLLGGA
jgi:hypothetical protein